MQKFNSTIKLAELTSGIEYESFSQEQINDLKYKILDWLGCAIGGSSTAVGIKIKELFTNNTSKTLAMIIGGNFSVDYMNAAYANGMLGHILELDDVHKSSISHPGAIAVPVALSIGQAKNTDIKNLFTGIAAGYEAMVRLGDALNPSHYDYWHTTGTCGTFASAATACRVKNLSLNETNKAFNIASTTASGLVSVFGTDTKLITVGHACQAGIMASLFAENGFSSPENVFDIDNGYVAAVSNETKLEDTLKLNEGRLAIDTAFYKIHASCGHTHSAIDAVLSLLSNENISLDEIFKVEVGTYKKAVELTGEFKNENDQKAKFSLPYCISCALLFGRVSLKEFDNEMLKSQEIMKTKDKVIVYHDSECTEWYPVKRAAKVKIITKAKVFEKVVELPFGKPPKKFLEDKYMSLATMTINENKAYKIMEHVLMIDKMNKVDEFTEFFKKIF
jgi:2-methylcitrate dehydratase PrpD